MSEQNREKKLVALIQELAAVAEEAGWVIAIPPDDGSGQVPGLFIGMDAWVTDIAKILYPNHMSDVEAYSYEGNEVQVDEEIILPNPNNKKSTLH